MNLPRRKASDILLRKYRTEVATAESREVVILKSGAWKT
jgi:hypothetical protein